MTCLLRDYRCLISLDCLLTRKHVGMAVKSTAKLRYPEVLLPSSSFSRQETGKIEAIQSQEEAAAAPASTRYQARRMRRH
jgi:hypothetical protein